MCSFICSCVCSQAVPAPHTPLLTPAAASVVRHASIGSVRACVWHITSQPTEPAGASLAARCSMHSRSSGCLSITGAYMARRPLRGLLDMLRALRICGSSRGSSCISSRGPAAAVPSRPVASPLESQIFVCVIFPCRLAQHSTPQLFIQTAGSKEGLTGAALHITFFSPCLLHVLQPLPDYAAAQRRGADGAWSGIYEQGPASAAGAPSRLAACTY